MEASWLNTIYVNRATGEFVHVPFRSELVVRFRAGDGDFRTAGTLWFKAHYYRPEDEA